MSGTEIASIIVALAGTGGFFTGIYRAIRAYTRMELLQEQSKGTIEQKNREIEELKSENDKLWTLMEGITS